MEPSKPYKKHSTRHELKEKQAQLEQQNEVLRRVQGELEALRGRYFELYDLAPVGYLSLDAKGIIIETNLAAAAQMGVHRQDLLQQPITRYICREDMGIYLMHEEMSIRTGERQKFELRLLRKDGEVFWAQLTADPAEEPDGSVGNRLIVSDISMMRAAEEAVNKANEIIADAQIAKMQMELLQSQIKPHFMYNTLSAIIALCYTDGEKAADLLTLFSRYLRLLFNTEHQDIRISLRQNMELVRVYVEIEKARFGLRLNTVLEVDETLMDQMIVPLLIQPLVENAIRHGVSKKIIGGTVWVRVKRVLGSMQVTIADNGVGIPSERIQQILSREETAAGIGIANINQRLYLYTGKRIGIKSKVGIGTVVVFRVPLSDPQPCSGPGVPTDREVANAASHNGG